MTHLDSHKIDMAKSNHATVSLPAHVTNCRAMDPHSDVYRDYYNKCRIYSSDYGGF